jgi:hypothetical protein
MLNKGKPYTEEHWIELHSILFQYICFIFGIVIPLLLLDYHLMRLSSAILTLSGCISIYKRHCDSASTDECRYMIDKVSFTFFQSYVPTGHCILCQRIHECFVCLFLPSGSHNLNFLWNECLLYIMACHVLAACFHFRLNLGPLDWKKQTYVYNSLSDVKNLLGIC